MPGRLFGGLPSRLQDRLEIGQLGEMPEAALSASGAANAEQIMRRAEARNAPPFAPNSSPRLLAPWLVRDDRDNLLLYKCSFKELRYRVLSPMQALILPFFSGERTYGEIQAIWLHLIKPSDKAESLRDLDELVGNLTAPDEIIGITGTPSESFKDKRKIPLPEFSGYRWPVERTSAPVIVLVALTNRCFAECRYCYAERKSCSEMSCAEWIGIFDQLADLSVRIVDLAGADPFARSDLFDLLRAMVDRKFTFSVSTKSHISPAKARRLAELGIGRDEPGATERGLQISVDSANNELASWLTGINNYLERAKSTTANLVAAGLNPRIKCVLTPYNWEEVERIVELFSSLGARRFQFVQYGRSLYRHADDLFLSREQKLRLSESLPRLVMKHDDIEIVFQDDTGEVRTGEQLREAWEQRAICTGGRAALVVLPNGDVSLCEQLPHVPEYVVGSLLRESVLDIWNGAALDRFIHPGRSEFEGSVCRSCPDFDECHAGRGYCYRDSLSAFGSMYDAPPGCPRQLKAPLRLV
jgi:radical SAM protein with 4Fe4S-binding SPASM domain